MKWQPRALVVMMLGHKRLGFESPMAVLDVDMLQYVALLLLK
jgi:hypothetical protein